MRGYLSDVGGESWLERRLEESDGAPNGGELIVEFGGQRLLSQLGARAKPERDPRAHRPARVLRQHSAQRTWQRAGARQLVVCASQREPRIYARACRHRAGSAFSQESLRYVRLTDIGFRVPPALEPVREQVLSIVEQLEEFQVNAAEQLGIDEEGVPFHVKKEVTSALRRLAPIGLSTDILWTANARTLRHVIEMRTAEGAEEELRLVFDTIARIMQAEAPGLFQDFTRSGGRRVGA